MSKTDAPTGTEQRLNELRVQYHRRFRGRPRPVELSDRHWNMYMVAMNTSLSVNSLADHFGCSKDFVRYTLERITIHLRENPQHKLIGDNKIYLTKDGYPLRLIKQHYHTMYKTMFRPWMTAHHHWNLYQEVMNSPLSIAKIAESYNNSALSILRIIRRVDCHLELMFYLAQKRGALDPPDLPPSDATDFEDMSYDELCFVELIEFVPEALNIKNQLRVSQVSKLIQLSKEDILKVKGIDEGELIDTEYFLSIHSLSDITWV